MSNPVSWKKKKKQGWLGEANVSCLLRHRAVHLILAYSWARSAILAIGKGGGGMFLFILILYFHSFSSFSPVPLFHLLYYLCSLWNLPFPGRWHKMTHKGWHAIKPQHNQFLGKTRKKFQNAVFWKLILRTLGKKFNIQHFEFFFFFFYIFQKSKTCFVCFLCVWCVCVFSRKISEKYHQFVEW